MPSWLRIRNEVALPGIDFQLQWNDQTGTLQTLMLGFVLFEKSSSWQLSTLAAPDGANCWILAGAFGGDQSESNFTIDVSDNYTAAYNYGQQGFSLNIEPNS